MFVCVFSAVKKIGRNSILSGFQMSPGVTESFMGDGLCQTVNREAFLHGKQSKVEGKGTRGRGQAHLKGRGKRSLREQEVGAR